MLTHIERNKKSTRTGSMKYEGVEDLVGKQVSAD